MMHLSIRRTFSRLLRMRTPLPSLPRRSLPRLRLSRFLSSATKPPHPPARPPSFGTHPLDGTSDDFFTDESGDVFVDSDDDQAYQDDDLLHQDSDLETTLYGGSSDDEEADSSSESDAPDESDEDADVGWETSAEEEARLEREEREWTREFEEWRDAVRPIGLKRGGQPISKMDLLVSEDNIEETFVLGSGKGGQKVNKTHNAVALKHIPTGFTVKCHAHRSLEANRKTARRLLQIKVDELTGRENKSTRRTKRLQRRKSRRRARAKKKYAAASEES